MSQPIELQNIHLDQPQGEPLSGNTADCGTSAVMNDDRILVVPETMVVATWYALRQTRDAPTEAVVMWAVPKDHYRQRAQVVTTVIVPRQRGGRGLYEVPAAAVREMGKALRERGLVNVAQVHSHPASWVGHSEWDDLHAFSLRDGALSIVWPNYARWMPSLRDWGVHECRGTIWRHLSEQEAATRLQIMPAMVDLRIQQQKTNGFDDE